MKNFKNPASILKSRISIEQYAMNSDGGGGFTTVWTELARVWANVTPITFISRNGEKISDGQNQVRKMHKIIIRMRNDLNEEMRINHNGRIYNIRAIVIPDIEKDIMEIITEEGVAV